MLQGQRIDDPEQSDEGDDFSQHQGFQLWQTKALTGRECTDPARESYCPASN